MKNLTYSSGKSTLVWASAAIGASIITVLGNYSRKEILRRGYPSWDRCLCDFKLRSNVFQVWHSKHEQRGETIFAQEWGVSLPNPPKWLRRVLHHSAQVIATLNPGSGYVERVTLNPQEARKLATLLRNSFNDEEAFQENAQIIWKSEILHEPQHFFDSYIRRLYPVQIPPERTVAIQPLPAVWDPQTKLPLPSEASLLKAPIGTRIDCIGWTSAQLSYCTARLKQFEKELF